MSGSGLPVQNLKGGLDTIHLSGKGLKDTDAIVIAHLIADNPSLTQLKLNSKQIGEEGAKALGDGLKKNKSLIYLDLSGSGLPVQELKGGLDTIDLSGKGLRDIDAIVIAHLIADNTSLTQLNLNSNEIGREGAKALGDALEKNKSLVFLDLSGGGLPVQNLKGGLDTIDLSGKGLRDIDAIVIAHLIADNTSLKQLNLNSNEIGREGAKALGDALEKNKTLVFLDLSGTGLPVQNLKGGLDTIDLSGKGLRDIDAIVIAHLIADNTSLKQLNLKSNEIGEEGAKALGDGLKKNKTLVYLAIHLVEEIYVKLHSGRTITLLVELSDTVAHLMSLIQEEEGIHPDHQRLIFANEQLERERPLSDYGIRSNSTIHLVRSYRRATGGEVIYVKNCIGDTITLLVEFSDTVAHLMSLILEKYHIHPDHQRLIFADKVMERERPLSDYGIQANSTIYVMLQMTGMISAFTTTDESDVLTRWLMLTDAKRATAPAPPKEHLLAQMRICKASFFKRMKIRYTGESLLSRCQRQKCICFMNEARQMLSPQSADMKITFTSEGEKALASLLNLRSFTPIHRLHSTGMVKIAFRRTEAPIAGCIGWHCDGGYARNTVQITLNDDTEYEGGRICFVVGKDAKLIVPSRPAGTLTEHRPDVLHGVTRLHRGVRYSLFVVDLMNGLGERDVHNLDEDEVSGIARRL